MCAISDVCTLSLLLSKLLKSCSLTQPPFCQCLQYNRICDRTPQWCICHSNPPPLPPYRCIITHCNLELNMSCKLSFRLSLSIVLIHNCLDLYNILKWWSWINNLLDLYNIITSKLPLQVMMTVFNLKQASEIIGCSIHT